MAITVSAAETTTSMDWRIETVARLQVSTYQSMPVSLALDARGRPHLIYVSEDGSVFAARHDEWHPEIVPATERNSFRGIATLPATATGWDTHRGNRCQRR